MGSKITWSLLLIFILSCRYSHGEVDCKNEPTCKVYNTLGMKAADCYHKDFYSFPKCVPTDVEVIELTLNRIRKVTKSDLKRYGYLKFLYLNDNLISKLDDETFSDMSSLSSLDLSINALISIPSTIFHLPNLKTLRVRQNANINIAGAVEQAKPIVSPLTLLDISLTATEDSPADFPDFGTIVYLSTLNITGNHYVSMSPKHFAGLCNLHRLINNNATTDYEDPCNCWVINKWLKERDIQFIPFRCSLPENKCSWKVLSQEDKKTFDQCKEMYSQIQMAHRLTKIGVGVGIAILVAAVISLICFLWIRRKRNGKRAKKREENNTTQTDGLMLLNKEPKKSQPNK